MAIEHLFANRLRELHHFNRTALIVSAAYEALLLERRKVLVNRSERSELQRMRNLFKTRRITFLVEKCHQVVQDFLLPFCQRHRNPLGLCQRCEDRRTKSESQ